MSPSSCRPVLGDLAAGIVSISWLAKHNVVRVVASKKITNKFSHYLTHLLMHVDF